MNKGKHKRRRRLLGDILRAERESQGISQDELAEKLGVSQAVISKTESGNRNIDVLQLMEYCDVLGISFFELAFKIDSRFYAEKALKNKESAEVVLKKYNLAILQSFRSVFRDLLQANAL